MVYDTSSKLGFTLLEFLGVLVIISIVIAAMLWNFQTSKVKARNEQRKANARSIVYGVQAYKEDFGVFPRSKDGKLFACGSAEKLTACEYGRDKLLDLRDSNHSPYLDPIPYDPNQGQGIFMYYVSSSVDFQVYAHLENNDDPEYSEEVEKFNILCGQKICNYGITIGAKPVKEKLETSQ